ncbi:MFS transporter [Candidatus Micrarchaeota archaeon]|nr:MFS transporter [Candidatus Micrarchaeota archaeon]
MSELRKFIIDSTTSLKIRNYRLYFFGQAVSCTGSFMQTLAQQWLVLHLTGSGIQLGLVTALQFLPVLLLSPLGGLFVDRFSKRKLLFFTQGAFALLATGLGLLVTFDMIQVWMIYVFALLLGIISSINIPVEHAFILELVGKTELKNAVTLDNIQFNVARVLGPTIGSIIIFALGLSFCFLINGISYVALIMALIMMDPLKAPKIQAASAMHVQLFDGVRYIVSHRSLLYTLITLGIIGTMTYEFTVSLPLIAKFTFNGDAGTYASMTVAMGLGAIFGGILTARQRNVSFKNFILACFLLGLAILFASFAPTLPLFIGGMILVGFCSMYFLTSGRLLLQLETESNMIGRVMSFWSIAFVGSTAIGGPLVGWVSQTIDPRWGLAIGGLCAIVAGCFGILTLGRLSDALLSESK